jgi:cellulose synthase/poly-beta-1,6-N-acetylglucosamine synthase-like glycosyltransferase
MLASGVTFTTVTRAVGLPAATVPASAEQRGLGQVMLAAVATARIAVDGLEVCLLVGGALVLLRLLLMCVTAIVHGRRGRARHPGRWPHPVSVVVPAFNEDRTIAATVGSLAASEHPVEIIVVDDGSTDGTADTVTRLGLANVRVLRQPNGGKPAALNAGVAACHHDIVVMLDGDTVFEPSTVRNLVARFNDPRVGAVAGNARVADRGSLLARWQNIEYVVGFNIDRRVQDTWHVITTVPGAVGAFRRSALLEVGGVSDQTLAEDTDLTIAIGRAGWRVCYEPTARAWTDAPATFAQLWRQRYRWSYGIMQSFWKHRHAVVERGPSGHIGRVGLLLTGLFQIVLPLTAPTIDIYLVYGLLFLDPQRTTLLWAVALLVQWLAGAIAFRLEREPPQDLLLLPLQQLVYRQLMYAVLIQSVLSAAAGTRLRWRKAPRKGSFSAAPGRPSS